MKKVLILIFLGLIIIVTANLVKGDKQEKGVPPEDELIALVNNTVVSFGEAVNKDDFTDFYNSLSKVLQRHTKNYNWSKACKDLRKDKIDLTIARDETPVFSKKQYKDKKGGMLTLKGYYEIVPKIKFELRYIYEDSQWKLLDFGINAGN